MLRKPQNFLYHVLPTDLYGNILPNLSFKNLSTLVEADECLVEHPFQNKAEETLKKNYPTYTNLPKALKQKRYAILIDNLIARVLRLFNPECSIPVFPKTERTYKELCNQLCPFIRHLIDTHLFSNHPKNELNPVFIHDLVFHYCQHDQDAAGVLLNKNCWRLWNTGNNSLAFYLVQYGANVNMIFKNSKPTLLQALTFNSSEEFIRVLINHNADYYAYGDIHHGVRYTYMLITALNKNLEALPVLIEKFPWEVDYTLETLDKMLRKMSDMEFPREHGIYFPSSPDGKPLQQYYSIQQIAQAKELILQTISAVYKVRRENLPGTSQNKSSMLSNPGPLGLFQPLNRQDLKPKNCQKRAASMNDLQLSFQEGPKIK